MKNDTAGILILQLQC